MHLQGLPCTNSIDQYPFTRFGQLLLTTVTFPFQTVADPKFSQLCGLSVRPCKPFASDGSRAHTCHCGGDWSAVERLRVGGGVWEQEAEGGALALEGLHRQVLPFMLRRTKAQVTLSSLSFALVRPRPRARSLSRGGLT